LEKYGYFRKDSKFGSSEEIKEQLACLGCSKIIEESSKDYRNSTKLNKLIKRMKKGSTLVILSMGQLSKSVLVLIEILEDIMSRNLGFISSLDGIVIKSTDDKMASQINNILSMFINVHSQFIHEEKEKKRKSRKVKGDFRGRPSSLNNSEITKLILITGPWKG